MIEEEPSEDDYDLVDEGHELLGVFRIVPPLPNQIAIFRGPILRVTRTPDGVRRQVRDTVIHELGHYFGLTDGDMVY